jgi:integrase
VRFRHRADRGRDGLRTRNTPRHGPRGDAARREKLAVASLLLVEGVDLEVVSETFGHSSIRVTSDAYRHLLEPAKQEAAEAMTVALWGE